MKTLIFNGSPHKSGDTAALISEVTAALRGEYKVVDSFRGDIHPCVDCRYCWENSGCQIEDGMQEVYSYIQECDNILIASPIYFSELTGSLLNVASRLQTYYCAERFRKEVPIPKPKRGAVILVGGGDGTVERPYATARILLHQMNVKTIFPAVISHTTNLRPASEDKAAVEGAGKIALFFNGEA